jgi:soluble lytic murein transglycosylase-like protein
MKAALIALILQIAAAEGVPPYMMVALAEIESNWDIYAVGINRDGTTDRGLMQLNSSWYDGDVTDVEEHITVACRHMKTMHRYYNLNWWQSLIAYNCGIARFLQGPPESSVQYANKVFELWKEYDTGFNQYVGR